MADVHTAVLRHSLGGAVVRDRLGVAAALGAELFGFQHLPEIHVFYNADGTTGGQIPVIDL